MSSSVTFQFSAEQVITLAPDTGAAQSSRGLATSGQWLRLGQGAGVIWGECQGSAAEPYQTQVDLTGPAFQCGCPSRKRPCKHGLGLLLLFAGQPQCFEIAQAPAWVSEWLATLVRREQVRVTRRAVPWPVEAAAQARRPGAA